MKKYLLAGILLCFACLDGFTQALPHVMTPAERQQMPAYLQSRATMVTTPPSSPVRTIAEWEELQGLLITWTSYQSILKEIVRHAKTQTRVYIVCSNTASVISYLASNNIDTVNVSFMNVPFNSVWSRDYGPWSAYTNDVDSLITVDWIYNRPRPLDDVIPQQVANILGTAFYETNTAPWDLVHTGGNFMTDGCGTGFSSKLILNENPGKSEAQIDSIMQAFMGINRYIKMNTLPYDVIHHIDMHVKLLDEETILWGEYPPGVADGPQIEANLLYVLNNYPSVFGTPYKILRIPMPADNGQYPNNGGDYFTYTNSSFINKTIIVPVYNIPSDTTALRIYREALPGYEVVGINSLGSIGALGALHCITKELGTDDPLLIRHQPLPDTYDDVNPYTVSAYMNHRSGIASATMYYRTDTLLPYVSVNMFQGFNPAYWLADIPAQPVGTEVYYYVEGESSSGKTQVRPMPAPAGYWHFRVLGPTGISAGTSGFVMEPIFPNPSGGITCIPVHSLANVPVEIMLERITGEKVKMVHRGNIPVGQSRYFIDTQNIASGVYLVKVVGNDFVTRQKLVIRH